MLQSKGRFHTGTVLFLGGRHDDTTGFETCFIFENAPSAQPGIYENEQSVLNRCFFEAFSDRRMFLATV